MKKYIILLVATVFVACVIIYARFQFKVNKSMVNFENNPYTSIVGKNISSAELATLINKAMNKNADNEVQRDENGYFIENDENSIKIDVHFLLDDTTLKAEQIEKSDLNLFITAYSSAQFKCTKIEYHNKSKLVKYLYIEEQE